MTKKFFKQFKQGIVVATALGLLAITHRYARDVKEKEEFGIRLLYESDDDRKCLEDEFCRFVLGFFLLVTTPLLIFWNENQFVKLEKLYNAAKRCVVDLSNPKLPQSAAMDGQFVCFSGKLEGGTTLSDDLFPCVTSENALLLKREIEIYQLVQKKSGDDYKIQERWCRMPQPDPSRAPGRKNSNGNWELFSDKNRMVNTGYKFQGEPVSFGDNVVLFRAPNPEIGEFAIPEPLMNEAFIGERNVHRLGELTLIKESQGAWIDLRLSPKINPQSSELVAEGVYNCYVHDEFVYDGPRNRIGTIRMKWSYACPQDMTVAAEAIAPGRAHVSGYDDSTIRNIKAPGTMRLMVMKDLSNWFHEERPLLLDDKKWTTCKQWSLAPFSVSSKQRLPPYEHNFIGRLWLYAPGLYTSKELFRRAHRASSRCLWKVRGISYVLLFAGWCLVFEPLSNIFYFPILRSLLSLAFASFAFVLATTCCLSCTAIARIFSRPFQSILLIGTVWVVVVELSARLDKQANGGI